MSTGRHRLTRTLAAIALTAWCAHLSAAQQSKPPDGSVSVADSSINNRLTQLEQKAVGTTESIRLLNTFTSNRFVVLNCDTENYIEGIPTSLTLPFLVSCEKVKPYMEGYELSLLFGNPHSVSFVSISGTLFYGDNPVPFAKTIDFSSPNKIVSGQWNRVIVHLNPAKASELHDVAISFSMGAASLAKAP